MAPMMKTLIAAFALATTTSAMPLALDRRGVIVNTVTETTWTTVDVTKTVYAGERPTPEAQADSPAAAPAATTPAAAPAAPSPPAAVSVAAPVAAPVAPVEKPAEQPAAAANFAEQAAVQPSAAPAVSAAPSPSSPAPAAATPNVPKTAGAGSGTTYTGDFTHYDGGLGACGWNVNTASDFSIAMPVGMMGAQSNGNPYCGRKVVITSPETGAEIAATVGDKCMGCVGSDIDATNALFQAVTPNGDGRVKGVSWRFAD